MFLGFHNFFILVTFFSFFSSWVYTRNQHDLPNRGYNLKQKLKAENSDINSGKTTKFKK